MTSVRVLAATGFLGTGFRDDSLAAAMAQAPDVIGCDAGSTDGGPYYLGSGQMMVSSAAIEHDLERLVPAALDAGVPLLVGSAGTAGGTPHLEGTLDLVRRIAHRQGRRFRLAAIDAQIDRGQVRQAMRDGRLHPLPGAPALSEEDIQDADRIVAQMGAEPFQSALDAGADVVIAGRASDAAIFSAVPLQKGAGAGPSWHAAKILECGAAAVRHRLYPDCMLAEVRDDDFSLWPPNPALACSPQSVAAHTLYENADPFLITEPSGRLDTSDCEYLPEGERGVRVTGSRFASRSRYDVRLEAVARRGHRYLVPAGIRDPYVLRHLDDFLAEATDVVRSKAEQSLGLRAGDFELRIRVYGRDGCLGDQEPERDHLGHEVGLHLEVCAADRTTAQALATLSWHTILHHPIPEWSGLISNLAFPYSPPEIDLGPAYEFIGNHVMEVDDPLAPFELTLEEVTSG